jgi:hypothetical protein
MGIGASLGNAIGQLPQNQSQQAGQPLGPVQPQTGMSGKGGAAQQPVTQQQVRQGLSGKGMGQQQPLGFSSLQNQPARPQGMMPPPPLGAVQPQMGMGGKGMSQPRGTLTGFGPTDAPIYSNDPNAVPYTGPSMGGNFVNGVPVQQPPMQQPDLAARRAAFDAANPQPVYNPMNDPYAQRFGVPGDYVGTPAPQLPPQFMNRDQLRQMAMEQAMPQSTPTTTQPTPEIRRLLEQFSAQIQGRQSNQPQQPISFDRNRNRNRNRGPF